MFKQKPNLFPVISAVILLLIAVSFICQIGVTRAYCSDTGLQKPKLIPVYRLWGAKDKDHILFTDLKEKERLRKNPDWNYEGIECYIFETQQPNTVPLCIYYNPTITDQYCTTNEEYKKLAPARGYHYQGLLGYVYYTQQPNTVALKQFYNEAMQDYFLITDENLAKNEKNVGYNFKNIEGYVFKTDQAQ